MSKVEELRALNEKRTALEHIIEIANAIERLQAAFNAALLMEGTAFRIPKHVARFYEGVDRYASTRPDKELLASIQELQHQVQLDLAQLLGLLGASSEGELIPLGEFSQAGQDDAEWREIHELIAQFRRRSQTAVCLRMVLRQRGVQTEALQLPVASDRIRVHIRRLSEQERDYRLQARQHIEDILKDIDGLLAVPALHESMQQELRTVQQGLQANLAHIAGGKSLDALPFAFDTIEMQEEWGRDIEPEAPAAEAGSEVMEARPGTALRPGLLRSIWRWLFTPAHVSWRQIRSGRYRPPGS